MKNNFLRIFFSLACAAILTSGSLNAQSVPNGINYQAIARNAAGSVYVNQNIRVKISVLQGSSAGALQYSESHAVLTNAFGLFSFKIGSGTPISGTFEDITWNTANQFVKVEVDPNGGTSYTDIGTTELLSVPYALYAETSGNGGGGTTGPQGPAGPAGAAGTQGLAGPAGVAGLAGAQGPAGPAGSNGTNGTNGSTGPAGPIGSTGPQGPTGPGSGLNCWDTNGNGIQDASEDVNLDGFWNAADCRGAQGVAGVAGVAGAQGPIGLTGPAGAAGAPGAAGPAGVQGTAGPAGAAGAQGTAGPVGASGSQGPIGLTGPAGSNGTAGTNGANGPIGLTGPAGSNGTAGTNGANGPIGLTGPAGAIGATGPAGAPGAVGPQGPIGPAGAGGSLDASYDFGGSGAGRTITADAGSVTINASGSGAGAIGLVVNQSGTLTSGVGALMTGTGNAINAANTNANNSFATMQAVTNSATLNNSAVFGQTTGQARAISGEVTAGSTSDVAVRGNNLRTTGGIGVEGVGFNGVSGSSAQRLGFGVAGFNTATPVIGPGDQNATAVTGLGGIGVNGQTQNGQLVGVLGQNFTINPTFNNIGLLGQSENGVGVWGDNLDASFFGVYANGELGASGFKSFMIDHPADPANKYLKHFSIESDEVLNLYRGTITMDANGVATVTLPSYFHMINKDFSYQLTSIGAPSPNLYISKEIENGVFVIAGGLPNQKVSWTVYADRNDPYAQQNPDNTKTEVEKREGEKGKYLQPQLYGKPASLRMGPKQELIKQTK